MHFEALIHTFRILDLIDILTVAIGIYYMYKLLKDTRAVALLKGLLFFYFNSMKICKFNHSRAIKLTFI